MPHHLLVKYAPGSQEAWVGCGIILPAFAPKMFCLIACDSNFLTCFSRHLNICFIKAGQWFLGCSLEPSIHSSHFCRRCSLPLFVCNFCCVALILLLVWPSCNTPLLRLPLLWVFWEVFSLLQLSGTRELFLLALLNNLAPSKEIHTKFIRIWWLSRWNLHGAPQPHLSGNLWVALEVSNTVADSISPTGTQIEAHTHLHTKIKPRTRPPMRRLHATHAVLRLGIIATEPADNEPREWQIQLRVK